MTLRGKAVAAALAVALIAGFATGAAWGANPFADIAGNVHEANIDAIYNAGITSGCDATHYCPNNPVTRAQMGTFLARAAGLGKNLPVANGRGPLQSYCAAATKNSRTFPVGPCRGSARTVLSGGIIGLEPSIVIGTDGLPLIVFGDANGGNHLAAAHCFDLACSAISAPTVLDASTGTGHAASLAIGEDGLPVVSYYDLTNGNLKFLRCLVPSCATGGTARTLDSSGHVGQYVSLAIGDDGNPIVAYNDPVAQSLKIARCATADCSTTPTIRTLDSGNNVGAFAVMAIGTDGNPVVAYQDSTTHFVKVAHCTEPDCSNTVELRTVDATGSLGQWMSMAIGYDGFPIISYESATADPDLRVTHCSTVDCSTATSNSVDTSGATGLYTSTAIGLDGRAVISHFDPQLGALVLSHCDDLACTTVHSTYVDNAGSPGQDSSVAVGPDGIPVIANYDGSVGALKVARPPVS